MKTKRHELIMKIIETEDVCTQEALQERLREEGFDVTQATVSRDIKVLDLVKVTTKDGKYRYAKKSLEMTRRNSLKFQSIFVEAVISVDYALNIVSIRCHVGMANAVCAAIDLMEWDEIVGTLAGDDTIFVLLRTEDQAHRFMMKLNEMLGR